MVENNNKKIPYNQEEFLYQELMKKIHKYIDCPNFLDRIQQAYILAKQKHANQKRITGEDFIIHPLNIAIILAELQSEPHTIMAGLLHDSLEDTDLTFEELKQHMGEDVASIVEKTTKLNKIVFNKNQAQIENQQKMFLAMAMDIRVVLVKIADRLHNMQTLQIMHLEKQINISNETLAIYVPLTHRLGLFQIKSQLEDLALRYTNPHEYYRIAHLIRKKTNEKEKSIDFIIKNIERLFYKTGIQNFHINGRSKNIYSTYKKLKQRNVFFEEIFDLLAIRIIVDNIDACYQCLGIIHANYSPLPNRFKDYIAVPKANLYQSLHNTVLSKDGTIFEIQIRTKEMDDIAEKGIASHWSYKENKIYSKKHKQLEILQKLRWFKELIKLTKVTENNFLTHSHNFVNAIKNDILSENVYVFTPKREVLELPKGSTPIDFAFRVHSDIGYRMNAAIVNCKITPLSYQLQNGDIISIRTTKNWFNVKKEWLKNVRTSYAKKIIKKYLNQHSKKKSDLIQMGKKILDKELQQQKIEFVVKTHFIENYFPQSEIQNLNELYEYIGSKKINCQIVVKKIIHFNNKQIQNKNSEQKTLEKYKQIVHENSIGVFIEGLTQTKLKLANCCLPVFDEKIIGFISKGKGISIHRNQCINIQNYDWNKMVPARWYPNNKLKYASLIFIVGYYNATLLADITNKTKTMGINVLNLKILTQKLTQINICLKVLVNNIQEINMLIENLSKLLNIYKIYRGFN
ncbi:RelA/SpoT family protein [Candidatus Phytoplasma phoenicium]|nr:RelA/SpoT family protein [Candidatus Phytoplasma phoenicium]